MPTDGKSKVAFQWHVSIFDDIPTDVVVVNTRDCIANMGIACDVATRGRDITAVGSLIDKDKGEDSTGALVRRSHLVLVDMQWEIVGARHIERVIDTLKGEPGDLNRLCRLLADQSKKDDSKDAIGSRKVGLWLAAALSSENPDAEIVFFSTSGEVTSDPIYLALERLAHTRFALMRKRDGYDVAFDREMFFDRLVALQTKAVAYSQEAHEWVIGGLLIPLLLGIDFASGECGPLRDMDVQTRQLNWELTVKGFFPQVDRAKPPATGWRTDDGDFVDLLLKLIKRPKFRLASGTQIALQEVLHGLKSLSRIQMRSKKEFDELIRRAAEIGLVGQPVLIQLQTARDSLDEADIAAARELVEEILHHDTSVLEDFCRDCGGELECPIDLAEKPDPDRADERGPKLPFDLSRLRGAIQALEYNLRDETRPSSLDEHRTVRAYVTPDSLSVTYLDDSPGFDNVVQLGVAVAESLKKRWALYRGLPLALSFAFFYPVQRVEFLTRTREWVALYPSAPAAVVIPEATETKWSFGLRWTFALELDDPTIA